jgi:hypothetical protein
MIMRGALNHAAFALVAFTATQLPGTPLVYAQELSSVPFVGCASDGQLGPRKAPHGKTKPVPLSPALANQLAYYQAEDGSGVLAPRGWHCFSTYGSSGSSLFVAPQMIDSKLVFSEKWKGFSGPVIQISNSLGGTSGRFEVASIIARVFPANKVFVSKVIAEGIETAADFPLGPYPKDKLHYRSEEVVEYETPPQTEGLGTRSRLQKNDDAIAGAEILAGPNEELDLISLSVRLPQVSEDLTRAIIQQTEREAAANPTN